MMDLLEFVLSDFFRFCGFIIILALVFEGIGTIFGAITEAIMEARNEKKNENDTDKNGDDL